MRTLLLALSFLLGHAALAQTQVWDATSGLNRGPADAPEERPNGWKFDSQMAGSFSLTSSQDVVGQANGTSQTYGTNDRIGYHYFTENTEWRNDLFLRVATTRTPALPRFVKSDDELKLGSIYLYGLPNYPQFGPYARVEAAAPIFKGEDVRPVARVYRLPDRAVFGDSLRMTDGFKPLTTKEALGLFYKPVTQNRIQVEARFGLAAMQIAADGQYAVTGTNRANELIVTRLRDVSQAGLEAALSVKGKIENNAAYEIGAEAMTPFVNDKPPGDNRDAWRLTNVDAYAKLTSKITDWAAFGYDYRLKIEPQLVDRAQQIHMVVLNLTYPSGK